MAINTGHCQNLSQLAEEVNRELETIEATGIPGDPGADGAAATVQIGTVTTLSAGEDAYVINVGDSNAAILEFGIPAGFDGSNGTPPSVTVGTVTELPAGYAPTVVDGDPGDDVRLDFGLPAGTGGASDTHLIEGTATERISPGETGNVSTAAGIFDCENRTGRVVWLSSPVTIDYTLEAIISSSSSDRLRATADANAPTESAQFVDWLPISHAFLNSDDLVDNGLLIEDPLGILPTLKVGDPVLFSVRYGHGISDDVLVVTNRPWAIMATAWLDGEIDAATFDTSTGTVNYGEADVWLVNGNERTSDTILVGNSERTPLGASSGEPVIAECWYDRVTESFKITTLKDMRSIPGFIKANMQIVYHPADDVEFSQDSTECGGSDPLASVVDGDDDPWRETSFWS